MSVSKTTWYEVEERYSNTGWTRDVSEKHHRPPDAQTEATRRGREIKVVRCVETRETISRALPQADAVT